jgi:hypothetical protein
MARKVPASGINLFQLIYILIREYTERTGQKPLNLSLGNPDGVPDPRVLELQARFAKDPAYDLHTYAEDKNINQFAELMVRECSQMVHDSHSNDLPFVGGKMLVRFGVK